jgi:hypothetical protein
VWLHPSAKAGSAGIVWCSICRPAAPLPVLAARLFCLWLLPGHGLRREAATFSGEAALDIGVETFNEIKAARPGSEASNFGLVRKLVERGFSNTDVLGADGPGTAAGFIWCRATYRLTVPFLPRTGRLARNQESASTHRGALSLNGETDSSPKTLRDRALRADQMRAKPHGRNLPVSNLPVSSAQTQWDAEQAAHVRVNLKPADQRVFSFKQRRTAVVANQRKIEPRRFVVLSGCRGARLPHRQRQLAWGQFVEASVTDAAHRGSNRSNAVRSRCC